MPIQNNTIVLKPAVCVNTVGYFLGSVPTGGNSTYAYQWQYSTTGCGGTYTNVAGATGRDFAIPASDPAGYCYRRVVTSGACTNNSTGQQVNTADRTTPAAPAATVVQPTCLINTGSISVTSPTATSSGITGITYSINGTSYLNTTGDFLLLPPGTYNVTARMPTGCISPVLSVTLNPPSFPNTVSPSSATVCTGSTQVFTAPAGGTSYQWYRNGVLIPLATTNSYTASQAGTYYAVITSGLFCVTQTNNATLTVVAPPSGSISPASTSICAGSSAFLTATGGGTYQWFKNGNQLPGETAATYLARDSGIYSVNISNNVCTVAASNSAKVTVDPLPTGTITPPSATICEGGTQLLTVNGGVGYQWFLNGQPISSATASTYSAGGAGTYTADIISNKNCKAKAGNSVVVSVTPLPTGTVSPAAFTMCAGDSITLTATGGNTYQWYKDGNPQSVFSATYKVKDSGKYTVDIFDIGNCKGKASNESVVTVKPTPTGTISPATAVLCPGSPLNLSVSGGTSYQWYRNDTLISGATAANYAATLAGRYTADIILGTCKGRATASTVTQGVIPTGSVSPATGIICPSSSLTLTANGGTSYQWYRNDTLISGATAATYNASQAGTYRFTVSNGSCAGPSANNAVVTLSTLQATATTTNITCTQSSGTVTVTAGGGTAPYQYSLDNNSNYQSGNSFTGLTAGAHKVTVKDAAGCLFSINITVTQVASTLAVAPASVTNATCGQANGVAAIQASGGVPGYTYSLNGGAFQSAATFTGLAVGAYKVTVKDNAGCVSDVTFEVKQLVGVPNLVITNPPKICPGTTANLQSPTVTAGSDAGLAYSYWRDANASSALSTPAAVTEGTYYIRAANSACVAVKPVVVTAQTVFPGSITSLRTTACFTDSLPLTASGGVSYQWYRNDTLIPGATKVTYDAKQSGLYSVSISDGTCAVKASNTVQLAFQACTPIFEPRVYVPTAFTPNRNGANDVLRPIFYNISKLTSFKVFNRWGQQVFATATAGKGWDGAKDGVPQPPETYSWILECVGKNGEVIKQSGRSLLIR